MEATTVRERPVFPWHAALTYDRRPTWATLPVRVRMMGQDWAVSADQRIIVAVTGAVVEHALPPVDPRVQPLVARFLGRRMAKPLVLPFPDFKLAIGRDLSPKRDEPRFGRVCGVMINRNALARVLRHMQAEHVGIAPISHPRKRWTGGGKVQVPNLFIDAPGRWRIVVSAVDPSAEPDEPDWPATP